MCCKFHIFFRNNKVIKECMILSWTLCTFCVDIPQYFALRHSQLMLFLFGERWSFVNLMFIGPCIIVIVEEWKTNLMSLAILFHFLCAQHVSDINTSIIRSLRLCWWITTWVVLFSVRCVLEIWCCWFWVVLVLQTEAQLLQPAKRTPASSWWWIC